jgi:hypothetical protein
MGLCKFDQRSKMRITISLGNFEELYGAQDSHSPYFIIGIISTQSGSWFCGISTISIILGYY